MKDTMIMKIIQIEFILFDLKVTIHICEYNSYINVGTGWLVRGWERDKNKDREIPRKPWEWSPLWEGRNTSM